MISRPTTDNLVKDIRREILEVFTPALDSEASRITGRMLDQVLSQVAVRCAHEIAWMREETESMEAYARDAAELLAYEPEIAAALQALETAPAASLHLHDVVETYSRAGAAFSAAIDAVAGARNQDLLDRARTLLDVRAERERQIDVNWSPVGRD